MPSRYEQFYELPENLYSDGSPVILSRGVLLKDSQTGSIIVQLKFQNVSTQVIKAVKVSVVPYDVTGAEIEGSCDYQYLDLNVRPGKSFGSKKAIIISNSVCRSFSVKSLTVIMDQGEVHEVSMPMDSLPESETLQNVFVNSELVKQYQFSVNREAQYVPQEAFSIWQCSCGEWNSRTHCTRCSAKKTDVFSCFNIPVLTEDMNTRLAEEAERRAKEQQEAEQREKEKKELQAKRKKIGIGIAICVIAVTIILVVFLGIIPSAKRHAQENAYTAAMELMEAGQYEEAIAAFEELGDYGYSVSRIKNCRYLMARELMDNEQYEEAIPIFEEMGNYLSSRTMLKECNYILAQELIDAGQYEEAIAVFEELEDYEDSASYLSEARYLYAMDLYDDSQYDEALAAFKELGDYKDSYSYAEELSGETIVDMGTCGTDVTWMLNNIGTLTIYGSGKMEDYEYVNYVPWYSSNSDITSVVIEDGVTSIGYGAFSNCTNLTDVTIPNSVTSIGGAAFYECSSLVSVVIPNSVTSIGDGAFYECSNLVSVEILGSITSIGYAMFAYCNRLTSVSVPSSVASIEEGAFCQCTSLENVYYGGTESDWMNISIGDVNTILARTTIHYNSTMPADGYVDGQNVNEEITNTSGDLSGNTSIEFSDAVQEGIISGTCGTNVTWSLDSSGTLIISGFGDISDYGTTGSSPWSSYRSSVNSVVIESGVTSIGGYAFSSLPNLTTVSIPDSVTSIGDYAFSGFNSLTHISIPNSVTAIGKGAFLMCTNLTSLDLPNSITRIEEDLCFECSNLNSVTIPDSVDTIGNNAFGYCENLADVYYSGSESDWENVIIYYNSSLKNATIHYNS